MAWMISAALMDTYTNSLFSPVPEVDCLAVPSSDGIPSVASKSNPTPQAYLPSDKMTAFSRPSRFGMTFAPLTAIHGKDVLTWFLEAFPVRTSAQPEEEPASRAASPVSGAIWPGSWARFDPLTCSWKTHQRLLLGDWESFSETWPRWGTMQDGEFWGQPMWERRTNATASGFLPTPTAQTYGSSQGGGMGREGQPNRPSLNTMASTEKWPTPTASDASRGSPQSIYSKGDLKLSSAVYRCPTPTASMLTMQDLIQAQYSGQDPRRPTYQEALPTPTASNAKAHHIRGSDKGQPRAPRSYGTTGQLNPTWVEWLMGWPRGWTALEPLATDKCPNVWLRHGDDS